MNKAGDEDASKNSSEAFTFRNNAESEYLRAFEQYLKQRNYSNYTQRDYLQSVTEWYRFIRGHRQAIEDMRNLNVFLQQRAVGKRTLNHDLSAFVGIAHIFSVFGATQQHPDAAGIKRNQPEV